MKMTTNETGMTVRPGDLLAQVKRNGVLFWAIFRAGQWLYGDAVRSSQARDPQDAKRQEEVKGA